MDCVISELCYNVTILQRNYSKISFHTFMYVPLWKTYKILSKATGLILM